MQVCIHSMTLAARNLILQDLLAFLRQHHAATLALLLYSLFFVVFIVSVMYEEEESVPAYTTCRLVVKGFSDRVCNVADESQACYTAFEAVDAVLQQQLAS